jgi:hypothetical protein
VPQVNTYATWFDETCLDMLLVLIVTLKHEEGSATLFRQEFVARIKVRSAALPPSRREADRRQTLLHDIETGMDETPQSDQMRSKIRNMAHWHLQFDAEEGPTIPVMAYLAGDNRLISMPRNSTLSQLHKLLEDAYQQWVLVHYLDDTNQKVLVGASDRSLPLPRCLHGLLTVPFPPAQTRWRRCRRRLQSSTATASRRCACSCPCPTTRCTPRCPLCRAPRRRARHPRPRQPPTVGRRASRSSLPSCSRAPSVRGRQRCGGDTATYRRPAVSVHELDKWVSHWMTQMPDGHTDRPRFRKAMAELGLQNDALSDKIFAAFDTDGRYGAPRLVGG